MEIPTWVLVNLGPSKGSVSGTSRMSRTSLHRLAGTLLIVSCKVTREQAVQIVFPFCRSQQFATVLPMAEFVASCWPSRFNPTGVYAANLGDCLTVKS